ncbi:hypothetical protein ACN47E_008405 [Coniothyrium glycines]
MPLNPHHGDRIPLNLRPSSPTRQVSDQRITEDLASRCVAGEVQEYEESDSDLYAENLPRSILDSMNAYDLARKRQEAATSPEAALQSTPLTPAASPSPPLPGFPSWSAFDAPSRKHGDEEQKRKTEGNDEICRLSLEHREGLISAAARHWDTEDFGGCVTPMPWRMDNGGLRPALAKNPHHLGLYLQQESRIVQLLTNRWNVVVEWADSARRSSELNYLLDRLEHHNSDKTWKENSTIIADMFETLQQRIMEHAASDVQLGDPKSLLPELPVEFDKYLQSDERLREKFEAVKHAELVYLHGRSDQASLSSDNSLSSLGCDDKVQDADKQPSFEQFKTATQKVSMLLAETDPKGRTDLVVNSARIPHSPQSKGHERQDSAQEGSSEQRRIEDQAGHMEEAPRPSIEGGQTSGSPPSGIHPSGGPPSGVPPSGVPPSGIPPSEGVQQNASTESGVTDEANVDGTASKSVLSQARLQRYLEASQRCGSESAPDKAGSSVSEMSRLLPRRMPWSVHGSSNLTPAQPDTPAPSEAVSNDCPVGGIKAGTLARRLLETQRQQAREGFIKQERFMSPERSGYDSVSDG